MHYKHSILHIVLQLVSPSPTPPNSPLKNAVIQIKKLTLIQHYLVIHRTHSDFISFSGNVSFLLLAQDPIQDHNYISFCVS